jgi:hypothetical protein
MARTVRASSLSARCFSIARQTDRDDGLGTAQHRLDLGDGGRFHFIGGIRSWVFAAAPKCSFREVSSAW